MAFSALPPGLKGPCTVTQTTLGTFNPATGVRSGDSTATVTVPDAVMGPQRRSYGDTFETAQTIIQRFRVIYVRAELFSFVPHAGDTVVMGGSWIVRANMPVIPDGVNAGMYELYVEMT